MEQIKWKKDKKHEMLSLSLAVIATITDNLTLLRSFKFMLLLFRPIRSTLWHDEFEMIKVANYVYRELWNKDLEVGLRHY